MEIPTMRTTTIQRLGEDLTRGRIEAVAACQSNVLATIYTATANPTFERLPVIDLRT